MRPSRLKQLRAAMRYSRRQLADHRKNRLALIKQYVGRYYGQADTSRRRMPINLLALGVSIYLRHLVARAPKANVTNPTMQLQGQAYKLQEGLNRTIAKIRLGETLERAALNAMFSWCVVKTALESVGTIDIDGQEVEVGRPYVDVVEDDDWIHDVTAKRVEAWSYCGNRYRLPYEYVMESGLFKNTDRLAKPDPKQPIDDNGEERHETVSGPSASMEEGEYVRGIDLWDMYLPMEGRMVTVPHRQEDLVLRDVEWEGPGNPTGPYRFMGFGRVPGQVIPLSPMALWRDMNSMVNKLYRKLERQAERQKDVIPYRLGSEEDAERVRDASDGEMVGMADPTAVGLLKMGGIDQRNFAFLLNAIEQFSWMGGNLDALGGLGPQSETLGQDQLLTANASKLIQDLQEQIQHFALGILKDLAWYLWNDPLAEYEVVHRIEGTSINVPTMWHPEDRVGKLLDYDIKIEPYSMQYDSPAQKIAKIQYILNSFVLPMMPMLQAQGIVVDSTALMRIVADYADLPELHDILRSAMPAQMGQDQGGPARPPVTERRNVRVNRSAGTRRGRNNALIQSLVGAGVQGSEARQSFQVGE